MAQVVLAPAFTLGEVSSALFGRFDLARLHVAASTMRNMFVSFTGGSYSRAGTAFVGYSKQTGRSYPPRIINFQFNLNQGLVLEFGNLYMRVVKNGAFVTEAPVTITGATRSNPCVLSVTSANGATAATANVGAVTASYAPGNEITLAGGTFSSQTVLSVTTTQLLTAQIEAAGTGYHIGDNITLAGGAGVPAVLQVTNVNGTGVILSFAILSVGAYTTNAPGNAFTQASTTGAGTGATFNYAFFGPLGLAVINAGSYTVPPVNPVAQALTTGSGIGATFNMTFGAVSPFNVGDWIEVAGVQGMTQLNGQTFVAQAVTVNSVTLNDVFGNNIDSSAYPAYIAGGTASRIYTLETPYAEQDLLYLKFTQSADVMSLCLVNQITNMEYPSYDLSRITDSDWQLTPLATDPTVLPPPTPTITTSGPGSLNYGYEVTSVDPVTGSESVASPAGYVGSAVNIAATAGSNTITWTPVQNVQVYRVYKATPGFGANPPPGSQYGFLGYAYGTQFYDTNIVSDLTNVPPLHKNPFARGQVTSVNITAGGSGYSASPTLTINTATGSGAVLTPVVVSGALVAVIVVNPGRDYQSVDTITITDSTGAGAAANLVVGPKQGTYPGVVTYFQQRRCYGYTLNQPDTIFMSQPGAYKNFDSRLPPLDDDAITTNPWAVQVNGIQWMLDMPGGLVVLTGLSAWQMTGTGGSSFNPQPITPGSQQAQPQAYNGSSDTVPPIRIDYDILYSQSRDNRIRDLSYQFYTNIYTGSDITMNSDHLFAGYTVKEWAYAEEPFKYIWVVRSDGTALTLTFVKPQEVAGWARHDTNGLFQSVTSVIEQSVGFKTNIDAVYFAMQRFPGGRNAYMIERLDDRQWTSVENTWCVDAGLSLGQPTPNATLTASSATGLGACTGVTGLIGGTGYSAATVATVVDDNGEGPGTGAIVALTIAGGVITGVNFTTQGTGYISPVIVVQDPSNNGTGFSANVTLNNTMTFTALSGVFQITDVGSVLRMGGCIATVTGYTSATVVTANMISPIVRVIPQTGQPIPQLSGNWTLTKPVAQVTGLQHLAGATVTGLYDGQIIPPSVVPATGILVLPAAASSVMVGLAFTAQLQSVYLNAPGPTEQGQRKKIGGCTIRVQASGYFQAGANQTDGSTLTPVQLAPAWNNLTQGPTLNPPIYGTTIIPLYTGDTRVYLEGEFDTKGQVALQQSMPQPLEVLALLPEADSGDSPDHPEQPMKQQGAQQ